MASLVDNPRLRGTILDPYINPLQEGIFRQPSPTFPNQAPIINPPAVNTPLNAPPATPPLIPIKKDTPDTEALRGFLRSQPSREQYQQNKFGKIMSTIAGIGEGYNRGAGRGAEVGIGLMEHPYQKAMEDWKTKYSRLSELSKIEREMLTEEDKARIANEQARIQAAELGIRQKVADSGIKMNDAQIANLTRRTQLEGLDIVTNEADGKSYVIDRTNPNVRTELGKYALSFDEKLQKQFNDFEKRFGVEQTGRMAILGAQQTHDRAMANLKAGLDEGLLKVQEDLVRGRPDPVKAKVAFDLALQQVHSKYPGMVNTLFETTTDKDGKQVTRLKVDKNGNPVNADVYGFYTQALENATNDNLGRQRTSLYPGNDVPQVNLRPADVQAHADALRQTAIDRIKKEYSAEDAAKYIANPQALEHMMQIIRQEGAGGEAPKAGETKTPKVDLTPTGPLLSAPGAFPGQATTQPAPMPFSGTYNFLKGIGAGQFGEVPAYTPPPPVAPIAPTAPAIGNIPIPIQGAMPIGNAYLGMPQGINTNPPYQQLYPLPPHVPMPRRPKTQYPIVPRSRGVSSAY